MEYLIIQISACCVLHNVCELQQEEFLEEWWLSPERNKCNSYDDNDNNDVGDDVDSYNEDVDQVLIRNALMNSII